MAWFSLITNFLTNLLSAIAWPGALLLIIYLFRAEIKRAIPNIEKFDAGKGLLAFQFNRQGAERVLNEVNKQEEGTSSEFYTPESVDRAQSLNILFRLITEPLQAIQDGRERFHRIVKHLAEELNQDVSGKTDTEIAHSLIDALVNSPQFKKELKFMISGASRVQLGDPWTDSSLTKEQLSLAVAYLTTLQIVEAVLNGAAKSKNITTLPEREQQIKAKSSPPPGSG